MILIRPFFSDTCTYIETQGVLAGWKRFWKPFFDGNEGTAQKAEEIVQAQTLPELINGVTAFHTRRSQEERVKHSTTPIHIVTGDQDNLPGLTYARRLVAQSKNAHLHVIQNCGHYAPLMQPAAVNSLIKDILRQAE